MDVRSIFISDLHLGWSRSRAHRLPEVLGRLRAERLYLVGDTFEWMGRSAQPVLPKLMQPILDSMERLTDNGCEITILPGNHDWQLSRMSRLGKWRIASHAVHETATGEKLFISHGDLFDTWIRRMANSAHFGIGNRLYNPLLHLGNWLERIGFVPPTPSRHWCAHWKQQLQSVRRHVMQFTDFMVRLASLHRCQGVICGHIHVPAMHDHGGFTYVNCGDWIEHCSFVVEDFSGSFSVHYDDSVPSIENRLGQPIQGDCQWESAL